MNSYLNLFSIVIILFVLIIIINIMGGSINFYESIYTVTNNNNSNSENIEAFLSDESVYNVINNITNLNKNDKVTNNKKNVNGNVNENMNRNVNGKVENFQNMNEFEPMSAKKEDSNIQSNLISICNQTQNDFHSLLENSP